MVAAAFGRPIRSGHHRDDCLEHCRRALNLDGRIGRTTDGMGVRVLIHCGPMSRVGVVQCPILIGRDELLEHADRMIADVLQGHGHTVFYSGQAGLGKTRLMRAIYRKAEAAGIKLNGGAVSPQDHQVPLASIRDLAYSSRRDPEWGDLAEDLIAIDGKHEGDALGARRLMVRAVADRLLAAVDRPTLLAFPDLHWTDEMSLEVIGELARHAPELPLLVLGDYRGDEPPTDPIHREWRARPLGQGFREGLQARRFRDAGAG